MGKVTRERFKTYQNVFDEFTLRNLFKLTSQGVFEDLISPIALGKESNVFLAKRKDGKKVVVKIYRLETCDFNAMYSQMKRDDRYQNIKKNKRFVIFSWTQREFRNLHKSREVGVDVPTPLTFMHNILVEEFIGDGEAAPMLKDSNIKNPQEFFDKVVYQMKKLYKGGIVHGDLSSFNILNWNQDPIFIDMSQSVELKSIVSQEYLERDVKNVCNYFRKIGLDVNEKKTLEKIRKL